MDLSKLTILAERANDERWIKWATTCYIKLDKCTAPLTAEEIRFSSSENEKNVDYVQEKRFHVIFDFVIPEYQLNIAYRRFCWVVSI